MYSWFFWLSMCILYPRYWQSNQIYQILDKALAYHCHVHQCIPFMQWNIYISNISGPNMLLLLFFLRGGGNNIVTFLLVLIEISWWNRLLFSSQIQTSSLGFPTVNYTCLVDDIKISVNLANVFFIRQNKINMI